MQKRELRLYKPKFIKWKEFDLIISLEFQEMMKSRDLKVDLLQTIARKCIGILIRNRWYLPTKGIIFLYSSAEPNPSGFMGGCEGISPTTINNCTADRIVIVFPDVLAAIENKLRLESNQSERLFKDAIRQNIAMTIIHEMIHSLGINRHNPLFASEELSSMELATDILSAFVGVDIISTYSPLLLNYLPPKAWEHGVEMESKAVVNFARKMLEKYKNETIARPQS